MSATGHSPNSWQPPHCPNPNCIHHNTSHSYTQFKKAGAFKRQQPPYRIQRFTCKTCKRSFSTQTFSTTYWQKLPQLDAQLLTKTVGGMANRQAARDLGVNPGTIDRHISRLARHCMLFHQAMMKEAPLIDTVVVDGFESFELSQYFPLHHHLAVVKGTDFFVYFTDSELRRKGRMTAAQKRRRRQLEAERGRPDPKAIEKDMLELLQVVLQGVEEAIVYSDDHPAYKRSIKRLAVAVRHLITSGKDRRDNRSPLWEVNLLDLLIRHCCANHRRETIAWSKRRQASAERLVILLVWRNYMKGRREKDRRSATPAMEMGMLEEPLTVEGLLSERLFRTRVELPPRWSAYYDRAVVTRGLAVNVRHELGYGY